jgi:sulfotransferase family protein
MTRIINMWASPRNISTAMMYAWAQRPDTTVWDEPMYGNYLAVTGIDHPMRDEILASTPTDAAQIVDAMINGHWQTPLVFYKNMAHHLVGFDIAIVDAMDNFLLTRDPNDMLPSLARGFGRTPTMTDAGYAVQVEIIERILASGRRPIVVDARAVLDDPRKVLSALCDALDIPFDEAMLSWSEGPKEYDGVWGAHWYTRLHATTGFEHYTPGSGPLPGDLVNLYEQCAPLYEYLARFTIA